jgi:aromatic-L-amino-acid/L-tryptophan decarboxylase
MTPDEFRQYGHEAVEWIANYLRDVREYPVLPSVTPGELTARLPGAAPESGEAMEEILRDFRELIVPATTLWNHPRFMAYFSVSASPPGILGEMLSAALNVNGMVWRSSPSVVELEQVVLGWLRQWLGLPESFFGLIYDTASISTMHAIAAAREAADPEARKRGAQPGTVLYTSEQSHSSVEKGAIAIGVGQDYVRRIPVDDQFRMRTDALQDALERDVQAGLKPFCITATVGTTSTTSVDPVAAIADIAERYGVWLHVDAAYGGSAAIVPELSHILDGAARADSLVMNPHKWLFTPIDCSAFFTRRPDILRRAYSLVPDYLQTAEDAQVVNLMDYGVPLGRRMRALKLWFVMRYYGREGVIARVRSHVDWAQQLARWIKDHPSFEVVAPTPLSVVCLRYRGTDEQNQRLMDAVNACGKTFLSHTRLHGRFVIRVAIGHVDAQLQDVELVWELLQREAAKMNAAGSHR